MRNYLVLMPGPEDVGDDASGGLMFYWAEIADRKSGRWQTGNLGEIKRRYTGQPVVVIAPAERFRFVRTALPGKSRQQLELAARYSLEDDIASEIEDVEVFLSDEPLGDAYTVTIVESEYLDSLISPLVKQDLDVRKIIPDALLLNRRSSAAELLVEDNRCLLKYDQGSATAINLKVLPQLLPKLKREHEFNEVRCLISSNNIEARNLLDQIDGNNDQLEIQHQPLEQDAKEYLLDRIIHADGASGEVDLIPARFKNSKVAATNNRLWRIAAGIFALAVVIQVSMDWWRINEAEQQLVITRDSQRSLIKSAFPEIGRIVNPEAQVKRALSALEQIGPPPAEFLNILTQSLIVPTRDELEIDLTGMTFADGVLLLRTQSREMGDLEKYRADLNKILTAEVVTAESTDAAVRGAIRVSK